MKFGEFNPRHTFIKYMITIRIQNKGSLPLFLVKSKRTYNRNEIPRIFPGKVVKAFKLVNVWTSHEIAQGYFRKHTCTHTYYSDSSQALMWGTWFNDHVIQNNLFQMPSPAVGRLKHVYIYIYMEVSENRGTPKSSILIGFSIVNHSFWGTPIFGNTHVHVYVCGKVNCPPIKTNTTKNNMK